MLPRWARLKRETLWKDWPLNGCNPGRGARSMVFFVSWGTSPGHGSHLQESLFDVSFPLAILGRRSAIHWSWDPDRRSQEHSFPKPVWLLPSRLKRLTPRNADHFFYNFSLGVSWGSSTVPGFFSERKEKLERRIQKIEGIPVLRQPSFSFTFLFS